MGKTLAITNPAGGDPTPLVEKIIQHFQKRKDTTVVVEFPCQGIPRLAYRNSLMELEQGRSIDQLLIDYDRGLMKGIHDYLYTVSTGYDALFIHPNARPDSPTLIKLQQEKTLIELPGYVKAHLSGYHNVIFLLQGQLIHPMTFFALREADYIAIHVADPMEIIRGYSVFKALIQDYAVDKAQIAMYAEQKNDDFKETDIIYQPSELVKRFTVAPIGESKEGEKTTA